MEEALLFINRLKELAQRSKQNGIYCFSDFLDLEKQDLFSREKENLSYAHPVLFGGAKGCERQILRFGDPEELGWEEEFPICVLKIEPKNARFADSLCHRDILGALMNLGIKRETLGDILIRDNAAVLFCLEKISPFITENLRKAKHTDLKIVPLDRAPEVLFTTETLTLPVSGIRGDCLVAKLFNLSRSQAQELFRQKKIFFTGKQTEDPSREPKIGEVISVRGYGKFIYRGAPTQTKKGKENALVEVYR